ncbi:TonB-dependent receptor [Winogradskyella psychrotolerans RS-3]|uniref:TonB-dependent receptor n=2 Tax=Winogradskyella TaxID=286104 RepID=S7VYQ8_9FLAO|nr:TonB-dependent receptor [Winogradskyella psychrotolerans RS-3]
MVISSIGYISQTIKVGNRSEINIQLDPEVSELSEVVVTAFWD